MPLEKTNVLFVCTMNSNRSPSARFLYESNTDYNVRSRGTQSDLTVENLHWADLIITMEEEHRASILLVDANVDSKVIVLHIRDQYGFLEDALIDRFRSALIPLMGAFSNDDPNTIAIARDDWKRKVGYSFFADEI